MLITIGAKPLAGFDQPLEMLKDCHRRIEHFLDVLQKMEQQFGDRELTDEGRRALAAAVNYFAEFSPRHTADEEGSLFPRLRRSNSAEAHEVIVEMERLESDHRTCEAGHAVVDRIVVQWLSAGRIEAAQRATLRSTLGQLSEIYAAHIHLEERRVFEVASRTLAADEIRQIGEEMHQRRSLVSHQANSTARAAHP